MPRGKIERQVLRRVPKEPDLETHVCHLRVTGFDGVVAEVVSVQDYVPSLADTDEDPYGKGIFLRPDQIPAVWDGLDQARLAVQR